MSILFNKVSEKRILDPYIESIRGRVLGAIATGDKVAVSRIGTSIEFGNNAISWVDNLLYRSGGQLVTYGMDHNRADGGSLYLDNGGDLGIAESQLSQVVSDLSGVQIPKMCIVGFGVNGLTASASAASTDNLDDFIGHWKTIASQLTTVGILPVFAGPVPVNSKNKFETVSADRHLARFCEVYGFPYLHLHQININAQNGNVNATYSGDGTHPNSLGADRIGKEAWHVLSGGFPHYSPWLCSSRADYVNADTFPGVQLGADNANVINAGTGAADSTSWGTGTGVAAATGSGYFTGHYIQIDGTNSDRSTNFYPLTTTAINNKSIAAGDVLRFASRVRVDVAGHDSTVGVRFLPSGGTTRDIWGRDTYFADDGVETIQQVDWVFESGMTNMRIFWFNDYVNLGAGTYGSVYVNGSCGISITEIDERLGV